MVKTDPILRARQLGPLLIILGFFWLVGWIVEGLKEPAVLIGALALMLLGVAWWRYTAYWRNIEMSRWIAVLPEGRPMLLAREQPAWDGTALLLPFSIEVRSTWKAPIICFLLLACLFSGLVTLLLFEQPRYEITSGSAVPAFLILFVCALWLPASIGLLIWMVGYQRIEVSEEGLHIVSSALEMRQGENRRFDVRKKDGRIKSSKTMIPWNEATLFTIYPASRFHQQRYLPIIYELSGPQTIVRWARLRSEMPWFPEPLSRLKPGGSGRDHRPLCAALATWTTHQRPQVRLRNPCASDPL